MKRWLILGCLLLAACAGIPAHFEKPRVSMVDIRLKQIGLLEQRFVLALRLQNPNKIAIPIDGLDVILAIDGKTLAQGVLREQVTLPALGEVILPIEVAANLPALFKAWRAAQMKGKYTLSGKLFVPMRTDGLSFQYEGELPVIEKLFDPLMSGG